MKPTKNQVFCMGCKKHKMLFESKSKAGNFIKYNSEEILGENEKTPVKSYNPELASIIKHRKNRIT